MQIQLANKSDKNSIKRFYKSNHYSASFMGDDQCFYMTSQEEIIASVIISFSSTTPFLHALVVNRNYQHQGLATQIVFHCQHRLPNINCFADKTLTKFYQKLGFECINSNNLPDCLQSRFYSYQRNNNTLNAFQYRA
ncbi:GNAT family N-acetyltransferase [Thalassotalea fonticola]|uniref:GNAT family N-acetyltransferase n=1 Tax=Thalassotalea fonticola TaxID=3065649 RepID=A0ABZ0GQX4_9GAMM|nr:GNAT family N-acetyltransferase [Colwelliaceae bacterium S1-1]